MKKFCLLIVMLTILLSIENAYSLHERWSTMGSSTTPQPFSELNQYTTANRSTASITTGYWFMDNQTQNIPAYEK